MATFVAGMTLMAFGVAQGQDRHFVPQSGVLWAPYQAWHIDMPGHEGNAFDVVATVHFEHDGSGDTHRTQMFYDGGERWSFRFTGTRTGRWTFTTSSDHEALDGWSGEVHVEPNPDPAASGFLTTVAGRFAAPTTEDGDMVARQLNVYLNADERNLLDDYSSDPDVLADQAEDILDEVTAHGLDALFVEMNNNWFAFGANRHDEHDSEDPSITSFEVLETLILRAHARGLGVHVWAWGDEERRWTPVGVGGINGEPDRRLQRYIAARLGPLPGWTMSYGFDLDEWVEPAQVRSWYDYLASHMGWPRVLMARETPSDVEPPDRTFRFPDGPLDAHSIDERPTSDFYEVATRIVAGVDVPVMFERRFVYLRDDIWDMDTTRRALWQFTLAGGVGAIWGPQWAGGPPYSDPDQLRTHHSFWRDRWSLDMVPGDDPHDAGSGFVLRDPDGSRTIVYAESTASVHLDLTHMAQGERAVAVDTALPYHEIEIGTLGADDMMWQAPYASDWVIAVGTY